MTRAYVIEILDRATFIPALAIVMRNDDVRAERLLWKAGYAPRPPWCILLVRANGGPAHYDPYEWGDRTMATAHQWLLHEGADALRDGLVVDVEYILGETEQPKESEVQP